MHSIFLAPLVSLLLLGCVSTSPDEALLVEEAGGQEVASTPQTDPCPAPAQPLITPEAEGPAIKREGEGSTMIESPGASIIAPSSEDPTAPAEQLAPGAVPGEALVEPTPPANEPPVSADAQGRPDAQSRMDVNDVPPEIPDQRDYFVTSSGLNVRSAPSGQSAAVRQLKLGEKVKSHGREGIWVQIGQNEYVSIVYLSERPVAVQADNRPK